MYNSPIIDRLISIVNDNQNIQDKEQLIKIIQTEFKLTQDRKVFYCDDFAIRFSQSNKKTVSNTVLSLSALKGYDTRPFFVVVVFKACVKICLANSTFLKKVSHSAKELRIDNIRGSFNFSDISTEVGGLSNTPDNFKKLFDYHKEFTFEDNIKRLVDENKNIKARVEKYTPSEEDKEQIRKSVETSIKFIESEEFDDLDNDLRSRVEKVQNEILIASLIENTNIRGRVIEYLIVDDGGTLKDAIIKALKEGSPLPKVETTDDLGDYSKTYNDPNKYETKTDIKTKIMYLSSNPKAYDIDKLLKFLSNKDTVYMIYLIGINDKNEVVLQLCSMYDDRFEHQRIMNHWSGLNSRGHVQFDGGDLDTILNKQEKTIIDKEKALLYINKLISL